MLKKLFCFSSNTLVVIFSISVANFSSAPIMRLRWPSFKLKCSLVNVMNILLQTKFKKANVMIDLIWRSLPYLNGMFFNTLENVPFHATKLVDRIWNFEINIKTDNIGSFITCLEKSPRWYDGDVRARPQQLRYSYFIIR